MSHSRRLVAVAATLTALVAIPATASAKSASVSVSTGAVQVNVTKAQKAVKRMNRAARLGDTAGVIKQLKTARSQTAAASRKSRKMATGPDSVAAAHALTLSGTTYEQLIASITALVDQVTGQAQALLAQAINPSLSGQQTDLAVLSGLLGNVPASIQPILASILTGLSVGDADEVVNMDSALASGTLPVNISAIVTQALGTATGFIDMAFATIKSIVPLLPAAVQGPLMQVLDMVTQTVGTLVPSILSTVTGLIDSIIGSLPIIGTSAGSGSGGLSGIFGSLLGGVTGGGQGALPGNIGDIINNLLGGILGGGTGGGTGPATGGIGGIISTVTGLISSLLGGLLGGAAPAAG